MTTTVVIPALNEAGRIGQTIRAASRYAEEIIVIDDGSSDRTTLEAQQAGARVLRNIRNRGYVFAIKRGFEQARGEVVVTFDADGEFPAALIPELVAPIASGRAGMVQGKRNRVPRPSERILTWLASQKTFVGDSGTGFRAIRADLAKELTLNGACICGLLALELSLLAPDLPIVEIPVNLRGIDKPRRVAWFHFRQFFVILPWLLRRYPRQINLKKRRKSDGFEGDHF